MRLTLTVLRCPPSVAPETRMLEGGEFSVGRGPGVDWVLADTEQMVSRRHFTAAFRGGDWQIADESSNGTFVNHDGAPIGKGNRRTLRDHDRLRAGPYEIEVHLEAVEEFQQTQSYGQADPEPFGYADPAPSGYASTIPEDAFDEPFHESFRSLDAAPSLGTPFVQQTQADHSSILEDAMQPPMPTGESHSHTGGVIPADDLLPDDWEKDLLEGIGGPAQAVNPIPADPFVARPLPAHPSVAESPAAHSPLAHSPLAHSPLAVPAQAPPVTPDPFASDPFASDPFSLDPFAPDPLAPDPLAPVPFPPVPLAPVPFAAEPPAATPIPVGRIDTPPIQVPPMQVPPMQAVPIQAPPIHIAPVEAPPIHAVSVEALPLPEDPFTEAPIPPKPARVAELAVANPAVSAGDTGLLPAFLRGVGLPDAKPADPTSTLQHLGEAFRALVAGLRSVLIARASIKSEFRIEQTLIRARGNNPLKFSADDDDAISALLGVGRRVDMTPAAAVTDALRDIRLHELASMAAMQSAVRAVLDGLHPDKVRASAEQGGGLNVLPGQRKARAWDVYEALHTRTVQALSDDFDSVFGKAFARAYEDALDDLSAKEKK